MPNACVKCRFLRVDPTQLPRIEEMTANATERLTEAQDGAWLGQVAALEESLKHLRQRRSEAEQQLATKTPRRESVGGQSLDVAPGWRSVRWRTSRSECW